MGQGLVKRWIGTLKHLLVDARHEPRRPTGLQRTVLRLRGENHPVRILDISASGAMVAFDGHAEPGETVILQVLDRGPIEGQVRWSNGGRLGIGFAETKDFSPT